MTVILDTKGNMFGGFTPVEWDSTSYSKADRSLRSFLFTLRNPHNIPTRRFVLKAARANSAIGCYAESGPRFGSDLDVSNHCNQAAHYSSTNLDCVYTNDTEVDSDSVFTGSMLFEVKEIEVFEITE
jgi:hypothetical protein